MTEKRFLHGFLAALLLLGLITAGLQLLLARVGELNLSGIVDRQLAAPNGAVLFSSGINQHAYYYKMMLLDRLEPNVVAIGSSRAMQVREKFFNTSFVNLGGAANNVAELELVANHIAALNHKPKLAIVFIDPWWMNSRYDGNDTAAHVPKFPNIVSADLIFWAAAALRHGNWIESAFRTHNLGIYMLLMDEGFARDGSNHYSGIISGEHASTDEKFSDSLRRIDGDRSRFEKGTDPDVAYVHRMCASLASLKVSVGHVVAIAPPFASTVWNRMTQGGYGYIAKAHADLRKCLVDIPFYDLTDPATVRGSTDCEFVDGIHGGDTTYGRILNQVAATDPDVRSRLNIAFVREFIRKYTGFAGGTTLDTFHGLKEIDFLRIGCAKHR